MCRLGKIEFFSEIEKKREKSNLPGIVPNILTTIHWMPSANDRCSLWTHLKCPTYLLDEKCWAPHKKPTKPHLSVADKAGIVAKNVKNITKKHRPTKYHRLLQPLVHIVLIASNPRSSVRFGAVMHSQSRYTFALSMLSSLKQPAWHGEKYMMPSTPQIGS